MWSHDNEELDIVISHFNTGGPSFKYTCEHSATGTSSNSKPEIKSKTIQTQTLQKNNLPSEFQITDGSQVNDPKVAALCDPTVCRLPSKRYLYPS